MKRGLRGLSLRSTARGLGLALAIVGLVGCVKTTENQCNGSDPPFGCPGVAPPDAGPPCGEPCAAPTPVCDEAAGECVGCLVNSDCPDAFCDPDTNTCVPCLLDVDCPTAAAPRCDPGTLECGACLTDADCTRFTATPVCGPTGSCVQCLPGTPAEDAAACAGNSCNPLTNTCTDVEVESVDTCEPCTADTECEENHFCVPMEFQGEPRESAYCLQTADMTCPSAFRILTPTRSSIGGRENRYCGVVETVTTCEAVISLLQLEKCNTICGMDGVEDARCETVNGEPDTCTISCDSSVECPNAFPCNAGYCGGPA